MFEPTRTRIQYRLRNRRASSVVLTQGELQEIRAAQRTFEGAYVRTALGQFSFALVVFKIFTSEFYSIGALFAVYGAAVMGISLYRRKQGNKAFFREVISNANNNNNNNNSNHSNNQQEPIKFRTSGEAVLSLTLLSLAAYITLLVLIFRLGSS